MADCGDAVQGHTIKRTNMRDGKVLVICMSCDFKQVCKNQHSAAVVTAFHFFFAENKNWELVFDDEDLCSYGERE